MNDLDQIVETKRLIIIPSKKDHFVFWKIEIKNTSEEIGQIKYSEEDKMIQNIQCIISSDYQKKGYAYEAISELLKYLFLTINKEKVSTNIPKDINSCLWLEKIGFKRQNEKEYTCTKKDFLKDLFHKQGLWIMEDIDKDPYIKQITDEPVVNIAGIVGSGKSFLCKNYREDDNCIVIDTDELYNSNTKDKNILEIREYLKKENINISDRLSSFDNLYKAMIDYYQNKGKMVIIDSNDFQYLKDLSLLKGNIMILRTCFNTCYNNCLKKQEENNILSFEEMATNQNEMKTIQNDYYHLNTWIEKIDKWKKEG